MKEIDVLRQIDRYLKGELSEEETDRLWELFLKEPRYLKWMEIETAAREHFRRKEHGKSRRKSEERRKEKGPSDDSPPDSQRNRMNGSCGGGTGDIQANHSSVRILTPLFRNREAVPAPILLEPIVRLCNRLFSCRRLFIITGRRVRPAST